MPAVHALELRAHFQHGAARGFVERVGLQLHAFGALVEGLAIPFRLFVEPQTTVWRSPDQAYQRVPTAVPLKDLYTNQFVGK